MRYRTLLPLPAVRSEMAPAILCAPQSSDDTPPSILGLGLHLHACVLHVHARRSDASHRTVQDVVSLEATLRKRCTMAGSDRLGAKCRRSVRRSPGEFHRVYLHGAAKASVATACESRQALLMEELSRQKNCGTTRFRCTCIVSVEISQASPQPLSDLKSEAGGAEENKGGGG